MREYLEGMKNVRILDKTVTIQSTVKDETVSALKELAAELKTI
jgi:hypothetical protein